MRLYEKLQLASSEEDVKDAYIKALEHDKCHKNRLEIRLNIF